MSTRGQGHSLTFDPELSYFDNIKQSPQKPLRPIVTKFHIDPPGVEGMKICAYGPGHMTNMATTPIYGKNL